MEEQIQAILSQLSLINNRLTNLEDSRNLAAEDSANRSNTSSSSTSSSNDTSSSSTSSSNNISSSNTSSSNTSNTNQSNTRRSNSSSSDREQDGQDSTMDLTSNIIKAALLKDICIVESPGLRPGTSYARQFSDTHILLVDITNFFLMYQLTRKVATRLPSPHISKAIELTIACLFGDWTKIQMSYASIRDDANKIAKKFFKKLPELLQDCRARDKYLAVKIRK